MTLPAHEGAARSRAAPDLLVPRSRAAKRQHRFSPGVVSISAMLSLLHLLNYLNYTLLASYFNPPATRSALLVLCALFLLATRAANLRFHLSRSWDVYAICFLALISTAYSSDSLQTLQYAIWLLLAVYVATELSSRVRTRRDVAAALVILFVPMTLLVAAANMTLGPVVTGSGRRFGALGTAHVDTAYAMDFICVLLALRAIPGEPLKVTTALKLLLLVLLGWSLYQSVFGLTRSVWLGVILTMGLYYFRRRLTIGSLFGTLVLAVVVVVAVEVLGLSRLLPDEVQARIEVTEQRVEEGTIDPRVEGIRNALKYSAGDPLGAGYAMKSAHNSYMNILITLGWVGFMLTIVALARSVALVAGMGFQWFLFFAIGSSALLLHAFFEVQNTPGQANFVPLLMWYALSRSRFVRDAGPARPRRHTRLVA